MPYSHWFVWPVKSPAGKPPAFRRKGMLGIPAIKKGGDVLESKKSGLVHIYCGDGKGKTTAALGLGLRACGCGKSVLLVQFLKGSGSGERNAIAQLDRFTALQIPEHIKFTFQMTEEEFAQAQSLYKNLLSEVAAKMQSCDVLILDEVLGAVSAGIINEKDVLDIILHKPDKMELVLTGRDPSEKIMECADYISRIDKVRHPYDKGVHARRGIEY